MLGDLYAPTNTFKLSNSQNCKNIFFDDVIKVLKPIYKSVRVGVPIPELMEQFL